MLEADADDSTFEPVHATFLVPGALMRNAYREQFFKSISLVTSVVVLFWNVAFAARVAGETKGLSPIPFVAGAFFVFLGATALTVFVVAAIRLTRSSSDRYYRVTIERAGIRGECNGKPLELAWSRIGYVKDNGTFFAFGTKNAADGLIIPKSVLTQPERLWAQLNTLLVAQRGLIQPTRPRSTITNTALV